MAKPILIAPNEPVMLELTKAERNLVLDCLYVTDAQYHDRIRQTAPNKPIPSTLDELEDLHGGLAFDANHTEDVRHENKLDRILYKIEKLLDTYVDQLQLLEAPSFDSSGDASPTDLLDEVPRNFRNIYQEIVSLTDAFCEQRLNAEYQQLCREMAVGLCQPTSPVVRGKRESWACGIVYALGQVNFLQDPASDPHVRSEEIAEGFGISIATMYAKGKILREGFELTPLDPRFGLHGLLDDNPLVWMLEINGFMFDIREMPPELQQAAYEEGLIPYVPANRGESHSAIGNPPANKSDNASSAGRAPAAAGYQLKITLDHSQPPIWRRVVVPDCTLEELHLCIQIAMGWKDCHLHEFEVGKQRFAMPGIDEFGGMDSEAGDAAAVLLSDLVNQGHKKIRYWYDFGDDWRHTLVVEKTLDALPKGSRFQCLKGVRACPPENIGGVWGYAEFLDALADPEHEQHEEFKEWIGEVFDPEAFDLDAVNRRLKGF